MPESDRPRRDLAERLRAGEQIVAPGVFDPLGARVVQHLGFDTVYLGGYATGSHLAVTEPLLTMTDQVEVARRIVGAIDLPLIVDGNAGFGEPLHTMRTVREFEAVGVAGIHIEDQAFPKRAHYHKGVEEVCSRQEFLVKLERAVAARADDDFLIIARTDAAKAVNADVEEAVWRCNAALDAGADAVMPLVSASAAQAASMTCWQQLEAIRAGVRDEGPITVLGGSVLGLEDLPLTEYRTKGFQIILFALPSVMAAAGAIASLYRPLIEHGRLSDPGVTGFTGLEVGGSREVREMVEEVLGLPRYYEIEADVARRLGGGPEEDPARSLTGDAERDD